MILYTCNVTLYNFIISSKSFALQEISELGKSWLLGNKGRKEDIIVHYVIDIR